MGYCFLFVSQHSFPSCWAGGEGEEEGPWHLCLCKCTGGGSTCEWSKRERENTCVEIKDGLLLNQREIYAQAGYYLSIIASNSYFWTENLASRLHALYPSEPYSTFTITLLSSLYHPPNTNPTLPPSVTLGAANVAGNTSCELHHCTQPVHLIPHPPHAAAEVRTMLP